MVVLGIVLAIALFAGWKFKQAVDALVLSEKYLQAQLMVCDLVGDFIEKDPEHRWPRSWADLEGLSTNDHWIYSWPRDARVIEEMIFVDFDASLDDILQQPEESFTAIRCNHPQLRPSNYGFVGWLKSGAYLTPKTERKDEGVK